MRVRMECWSSTTSTLPFCPLGAEGAAPAPRAASSPRFRKSSARAVPRASGRSWWTGIPLCSPAESVPDTSQPSVATDVPARPAASFRITAGPALATGAVSGLDRKVAAVAAQRDSIHLPRACSVAPSISMRPPSFGGWPAERSRRSAACSGLSRTRKPPWTGPSRVTGMATRGQERAFSSPSAGTSCTFALSVVTAACRSSVQALAACCIWRAARAARGLTPADREGGAFSFFSLIESPFYWIASAPPTISAISWVIWDCRARLASRLSDLIISSALSVAAFMATRRATCSQAADSTRAR